MMKKPKSTPAWLMLLRDIVEVAIAIAMFGIMLYAFLWLLMNGFQEIKSGLSLKADTVNEEDGVGRVTASIGIIPRAMAEAPAEEEETALWVYVEGEGTPPEWYRPDEPMAVEWYADNSDDMGEIWAEYGGNMEPHPPELISPGGVDWNIETELVGWDGHRMAVWEMELFSKIFYKEFWQPNLTLCEAGCDAMLQLWDLNGGTMFETLSHVNENGSYAFSTYLGVWQEDYDPDGLAWCRTYCEERFYEGPTWPAQYFRKGQYHDWDEWSPIPAYEIDGIYFSIGR